MTYKFDFRILNDYGVYMAEGLWYTLLVALPSIVIASLLGLALAAASTVPNRSLRFVSAGFVDVFRTVPVICLLFWIHYVLPILLPVRFTSTHSAVIALSLNGAAFACEAFRGALEAIPQTQLQAAYSLGYSRRRAFWEIVFPQAFYATLPALTNVHITIIKTVPVAVLIAVPEVMFRAQELTVQFFRPLELYTGAAVMYVALVLVFTSIMRLVERRRKWEAV